VKKNEETRAHLQRVRNLQVRLENWRRHSYMANARKSIHFLISTRTRPGIPLESIEKTAEEAAALKRKQRHSVEVSFFHKSLIHVFKAIDDCPAAAFATKIQKLCSARRYRVFRAI
jgi:hypothetical protein